MVLIAQTHQSSFPLNSINGLTKHCEFPMRNKRVDFWSFAEWHEPHEAFSHFRHYFHGLLRVSFLFFSDSLDSFEDDRVPIGESIDFVLELVEADVLGDFRVESSCHSVHFLEVPNRENAMQLDDVDDFLELPVLIHHFDLLIQGEKEKGKSTGRESMILKSNYKIKYSAPIKKAFDFPNFKREEWLNETMR